MKILHTADWHIGTKWDSVDRSEDLLKRAVPDVINIALAERVDMVLVAGDIFERQTEVSLQRAAETLRDPFKELLNAKIDLALLSGNHDSAPLFRFLRSAVELVSNPSDKRGQLYILNSAYVTTVTGLQLLHLPYMRPEQIEKMIGSEITEVSNTIEMANWSNGRKLDQIAQLLRQKIDPRKPALLAYHGIVKGASFGSDEQNHEFTYHQDYMLSPESLLFNDQVPQYNALGHVHRCQEIAAPVSTWYSGSVDRLDLGEKTYEPSVILVDFPPQGRRVECEVKKLPRPTPFLDETIRNETDLRTICNELGSESCTLALGRITLDCAPAQAYVLEQHVRHAFPRLEGVKKAILRPRNFTERATDNGAITNIKELANPSHTIRDYISEKLPPVQREGLLSALVMVEDELHAN